MESAAISKSMDKAAINKSMDKAAISKSMANKTQEMQKEVTSKLINSAPPISQNKVQEEQSAPPRLELIENQTTGKHILTVA